MFNSSFHAKWDNCRTIWLIIPVLVYLGIGASQRKNQIEGMDTQNFIHSVKLHAFHQMKPYSRVKTNWELTDTCISIFGELGQVRKIRPKCYKSWASTQKVKFLNSTFHIKWILTKIQIKFEGWFTPVLVYLGHWGKSRNLRPNTLIHGHVIHSVKLHILHQTKPYSRVKVICLVNLYLFLCICGIETNQLN